MKLVPKSRLVSIHPFAEFILSLSKGSRALSRRYPLNAYYLLNPFRRVSVVAAQNSFWAAGRIRVVETNGSGRVTARSHSHIVRCVSYRSEDPAATNS